MNILFQVLFVSILLFFSYLIKKRIKFIKRNILLGEKKYVSNSSKERKIKNLILIAFGQKKMFKKIIPAILHTMIYLGFIIINLEILEILIDGISGNHRVFAIMGMPYYNTFISIIELFVVLVLIACIIFLIRRNLLGINRFNSIELKGWPVLDANLILIFEIILMVAILTMNATDLLLQGSNYENYVITGDFYQVLD